MGDIMTALRKYVVFSGRARRREYWMFVLFYIVLNVAGSILDGILGLGMEGGGGPISLLVTLALLLPLISAAARRMHDTNRSGWWLLVPIANIIFALQAGTKGDNRFGPDPKA
jgi:uncharacterized membrane protein YhaH (DUF805 family)